MKRVTDEKGLASAIRVGKAVVMFHTTWCPFCVSVMPALQRLAGAQHEWTPVEAVLDDEDNPLWTTYAIDVVPTVIFFDRGEVVKRLDGVLGRGLEVHDVAGSF